MARVRHQGAQGCLLAGKVAVPRLTLSVSCSPGSSFNSGLLFALPAMTASGCSEGC